MFETIYVIYSQNFTQASDGYDLDILIQDLIKEEFQHNAEHYSIDEFMEYHADFYASLAPVYIKAKIQQLGYTDVKKTLNMFNEHFNYDEENKLNIAIYNFNSMANDHLIKFINELGYEEFEKMRRLEKIQ
ncbi:hypothetical protein H6K86_12035 [Staphylococcus epidermidis]|nr:hypothetical protein [Staphylococcus epidermidis]MBM6209891.1 hypothetical protein [Staphylococcus epidermidis]MBM6212262.1 hypothetical protein [Staphylococcus epidermidis]MBM6219275.1 hypothetical protein [Staphylococcus epidermidis]MBM6223797.1 hypothetical protein [Staphylococcus epidermidis]